MKIVSPFRPFPPENLSHKELVDFDWIDALRMLRASAKQNTKAEVFAITDVDTDLGVPAYQYATKERRLMLWILEVSRCYLESDDFDQDTVMLSPDILVYQDLRPYFVGDLGVVVRVAEKYSSKPMLNGAQWWKHIAKDRLVAFYREALERAYLLPENYIAWGADTIPIAEMLSPMVVGPMERAGLEAFGISHVGMLYPVMAHDVARMDMGKRPFDPPFPLTDFKGLRKAHMRRYFDDTIGVKVRA
jgi:hypothetical protein